MPWAVGLIFYHRGFALLLFFIGPPPPPPGHPRQKAVDQPLPRIIICAKPRVFPHEPLLVEPFDRKSMLQEIVPGIVVGQPELVRLLPAGEISRAKQPVP